jgi:hypothetical protein
MSIVLVGCAFIVAITVAHAAFRAPDQAVLISTTRAFTKPMSFLHATHKQYKCAECHHDYQKGKNVWQEGMEVALCDACHPLDRNGGDIMCLEKAYHDKCLGCHKKLDKEKRKNAPTACNQCHLGAADKGKTK